MSENEAISELKQSISQLHEKVDGQCRILSRLKDLQFHIDNDYVNHKCLECARDRERHRHEGMMAEAQLTAVLEELLLEQH